MGRLVITHSTYVEGLIPLVESACERPCDSDDHTWGDFTGPRTVLRLQLRVSTPVCGGYKVMARRGTTAQEVFVVTQLERDELRKRIDHCSP